jgi:LmbE family N-acetylglucosaminyl deacetylase
MKATALVLAPHPDDESITGLLALRLQVECGFRIVVVPATLGSRRDRRAARRPELRAACAYQGFQVRFPKS